MNPPFRLHLIIDKVSVRISYEKWYKINYKNLLNDFFIFSQTFLSKLIHMFKERELRNFPEIR